MGRYENEVKKGKKVRKREEKIGLKSRFLDIVLCTSVCCFVRFYL